MNTITKDIKPEVALAVGIAHYFGNYLVSISTVLGLLEQGMDGGRLKHLGNIAQQDLKKMATILGQLRTFYGDLVPSSELKEALSQSKQMLDVRL